MSLRQLLPVMDVIGHANKHLGRMAKFLRKYGEMDLFPVKLQVRPFSELRLLWCCFDVQAAVLLLCGFVPVIQSVAKFLRKYRERDLSLVKLQVRPSSKVCFL